MATHDKQPIASRPDVPGLAAMRMGPLTAGALGLLGLAMAVICGLLANNGASEILQRALVTCICLALLGGLVGKIAGHVIHEQLLRQADLIRQRDEVAQAALAAEEAASKASATASGAGSAARDAPDSKKVVRN